MSLAWWQTGLQQALPHKSAYDERQATTVKNIPRTRQTTSSSTKGIPLASNMLARRCWFLCCNKAQGQGEAGEAATSKWVTFNVAKRRRIKKNKTTKMGRTRPTALRSQKCLAPAVVESARRWWEPVCRCGAHGKSGGCRALYKRTTNDDVTEGRHLLWAEALAVDIWAEGNAERSRKVPKTERRQGFVLRSSTHIKVRKYETHAIPILNIEKIVLFWFYVPSFSQIKGKR